MRRVGFVSIVALVVASGFGCRKDEPAPSARLGSSSLAGATIAQIHWLGKKQIAAGKDSAGLMGFWDAPQSSALEAEALDKLSLAPWRLLHHNTETNPAGALLRPLLDDCVQQESYLEVRHVTNQPVEMVFAIRLNVRRADLWDTNLAAVFESLTGIRPVNLQGGRRGWALRKHHAPELVELVRAGEWTVLGLGQSGNALLNDALARIQRDRAPFAAPATNFWLSANLDLRRVADALLLGWNPPADLPAISLTVIGESENVRTRGQLVFPKPLSMALEPWKVPTNLIEAPLTSFTAIRGIRPWLASLPGWRDLQIGAPPNQIFFWAAQGFPLHTYFASPLPEADEKVSRLADLVLQRAGPWLATNCMGRFERSKEFNGLGWKGSPIIWPFLQSKTTDGMDFIFGGLLPGGGLNRPLPALFEREFGRMDLVCYDWELTGQRTADWIGIGQTLRFAANRLQLPFESPSVVWLQNVGPLLGESATAVVRTGPARLSFGRMSSVGFTAVELHVLADWLESPEFPRGFHTLLARPSLPPPLANAVKQ